MKYSKSERLETVLKKISDTHPLTSIPTQELINLYEEIERLKYLDSVTVEQYYTDGVQRFLIMVADGIDCKKDVNPKLLADTLRRQSDVAGEVLWEDNHKAGGKKPGFRTYEYVRCPFCAEPMTQIRASRFGKCSEKTKKFHCVPCGETLILPIPIANNIALMVETMNYHF